MTCFDYTSYLLNHYITFCRTAALRSEIIFLFVFVSQVIPQGVVPAPCIPCCLVVTDKKLLTCHQDSQTIFFRSLGAADISDITAVCLEEDKAYCVIVRASRIFTPPSRLYLFINLISLAQ